MYCRLKASSVNLKVELYMNGDQIDPANDRKLVIQLGIRDKTVSDVVQVCLHFRACYSDVVQCMCRLTVVNIELMTFLRDSSSSIWPLLVCLLST